jgi:hypothetical protein
MHRMSAFGMAQSGHGSRPARRNERHNSSIHEATGTHRFCRYRRHGVRGRSPRVGKKRLFLWMSRPAQDIFCVFRRSVSGCQIVLTGCFDPSGSSRQSSSLQATRSVHAMPRRFGHMGNPRGSRDSARLSFSDYRSTWAQLQCPGRPKPS